MMHKINAILLHRHLGCHTMSASHESFSWNYLCGATTFYFWEKNRELLKIDSFLPSYTYLGSWQTTTFREKILEILGDALSLRRI